MDSDALTVATEHPSLGLDEAALARVLRAVLGGEGAHAGEITVVLASRETVHALNRDFLGHDYPTDVLSFSLGEGTTGPIEGEVYVDLDTAMERHAEFGTTFEREAARYAIHGLLHLTGYDDATDDERQAMHAREDHYLRLWPGG